MTYEEAFNYINGSLTSGSVYGLTRIKELLKRLSNPEKDMKIIHIAGTNGKGSISRMVMSILASAGYTVGVFNSPYLSKRNEYLCVNGIDADDSEYSLIAGIVKNAVEGFGIGLNAMEEKPTEFEFSFAMAMEYFSRKNCDFAIVECGLGGLTDATNVFEEKALSIIANIGLDHTRLLGNSIKDIAKQKSGIIIKNDTVIAYPSDKEALKIIRKTCRLKNAWLITPDYISFLEMKYYNPGFTDNVKDQETLDKISSFMNLKKNDKIWLSMPYLLDCLKLKGEFQKKNALTALASVMALKYKGLIKDIDCTVIEKGLKNVNWPGRFDTLLNNPLVIADGGHNVQCVKALCESLIAEKIKKAIFVIGIMADKDYKSVFELLVPYAEYVIATEPDNARRLSSEAIEECFTELIKAKNASGKDDISIKKDNIIQVKNPSEAVAAALNTDKDKYNNKLPIIVTGSLYMMADIIKEVSKW